MEIGKKYIHYCWFGDAKLSHLAKKCIKSWAKYLPDYEVILWNEKNVDFDECPFIKEAYEQKKWAFVADYVRTKALYEYGGIYLDTDMKIVKDISFLLEKPNFIGVEDSGAVAVGVWGVKNSGDKFVKELLDFYRSQSHFSVSNMYSYTIPVIITKILSRYGFQKDKSGIQILDNKSIYIYPREYFYPLSYNYHNNDFSKNTCMIHYYDASWAPKEERRTIGLIRKLGPKNAALLLKLIYKFKALVLYYGRVLKRTLQIIFYPARLFYRRLSKKNNQVTYEIVEQIEKNKKDHAVFTVNGWLGVGSSTAEIFGDAISVPNNLNGEDYEFLANAVLGNNHIEMVIFSGFTDGWEKMIYELKKNKSKIKVKVFWHGSNAMHIDEYDWNKFKLCFDLLDNGLVDEIAFAKKSMFEQYKKLGYNVSFLPNNLTINTQLKKQLQSKNDNRTRIGIYASGDRWVKNFYNQMAAASLVDNAEVDVIPMSGRAIEFARLLHMDLHGENKPIPREKMLARIAQNDIVLYATFVECAPIIPLECLELGVICITGDNHHYWADTPLEKYLVEPKVDNPVAIARRIEKCLKHKNEILKLYREWKKEYDKYCEQEVKKFLKN